MVGEDTHVASSSRNIDLGHICGSEDCLASGLETLDTKTNGGGEVDTNLVGKNERQFYLVGNLRIATTP